MPRGRAAERFASSLNLFSPYYPAPVLKLRLIRLKLQVYYCFSFGFQHKFTNKVAFLVKGCNSAFIFVEDALEMQAGQVFFSNNEGFNGVLLSSYKAPKKENRKDRRNEKKKKQP